MIRYLQGRILKREGNRVLLLVGGVGFLLETPNPQGLEEGKEVAFHVHFRFTEEGPSLYGFLEEEALTLFELLLKVNGVGPKVALSLLMALGPGLLAQALQEGDTRLLASASGVGRRLAERMVLELKGKMPPHLLPQGEARGQAAEDATLALVALGFREAQARAVVLELLAQNPGAKPEDLIKEALKRLR